MSLLVKLTDDISTHNREPKQYLEILRKKSSIHFYLYVGTSDNPDIVRPAFWKMPPELKSELAIAFGNDLKAEFRCHFLHPFSVFACDDEMFFDELQIADSSLELPYRAYQLEMNKPVVTPAKFKRVGFSPEFSEFCWMHQLKEDNSLVKHSTSELALSVEVINLESVYVGDTPPEPVRPPPSPINRTKSIELDIANELHRLISDDRSLGVSTFNENAERILSKKYPMMDSKSMQRIIEVAKPDCLRSRHWSIPKKNDLRPGS